MLKRVIVREVKQVLGVRLAPSIITQIKEIARKERREKSDVVRIAIEDWLVMRSQQRKEVYSAKK
jgi:predicted transcriptional regulator